LSTAKTGDKERHKRWSQWGALTLERLPWPYATSIGLLWALGLLEQVLEEWYLDPTFRTLSLRLGRRIGLLILALYTPLMLKLLRLKVVEALTELRPVVLVSDHIYEARVRRMVGASKRGDIFLLGASVATVLLWFVVLHSEFPIHSAARLYLPGDVLPAIFMLAMYSLLGWALLMLFYVTLQLGLGLGGLAHYPLSVDVYDPTHLLPFGRMAMWHSLSVAGVVLAMILSLGQPTGLLDYVVIAFLSLASFLALILPIEGVYRQMSAARLATLSEISRELKRMHAALLGQPDLPAAEVAGLANRTAAWVNLRKVIEESPRWPFRNEAAVARAMLAALTPLIYFILNELLRTYVLPSITGKP
jgi:hypothetical protein